jgi:V/A-type H+-transporting ATPase subunit I
MEKVLLAGRAVDRRAILEAVRAAGIVHVEPLGRRELPALPAVEEQLVLVDRALGILGTVEGDTGVRPPEHTSPAIVEKILAIGAELADCDGGRQRFEAERQATAPWGRIGLADVAALRAGGLHVVFFTCPPGGQRDVEAELLRRAGRAKDTEYWVAVSRRPIVIAKPAAAVPAPERELDAVDRELAALEVEAQRLCGELADYAGCRRDLEAFRRHLLGQRHFLEVEAGLHDAGAVFVLKGWVPARQSAALAAALTTAQVPAALQVSPPGEEDQPPTHFENRAWCRPIEQLYRLMGIFPGYREHDISPIFLPALTVFTGLLIADAGYALCALLVLSLSYRALRRRGTPKAVIDLALVLSGGVFAVGALTNTWFGESLIRLTPFDAADDRSQALLQRVCFLLGAVHLSLAHLLRVWGRPLRLTALAEAGWVLFIWAMLALVNRLVLGTPTPAWMLPGFQISLSLVLLFTAPSLNPLATLGRGLGAIALNAAAFFSDIISYIRLWAVGLAGGILAASCNDLAGDLPLAVMLLVLVPAHLLNLSLGLVAVFAHGVRLNLLEFSNHLGLTWGGREYQPFSVRP